MTDDDRLDPAPRRTRSTPLTQNPHRSEPAATVRRPPLGTGPPPTARRAATAPLPDADRYRRPDDVAGSFAPHDPLPPDPGPRQRYRSARNIRRARRGTRILRPRGPRGSTVGPGELGPLQPGSGRCNSAPPAPGTRRGRRRPDRPRRADPGVTVVESGRRPGSPGATTRLRPGSAARPCTSTSSRPLSPRTALPKTNPTTSRTRTNPSAVTVVNGHIGPDSSCWPWSRCCWRGGIGGGAGYSLPEPRTTGCRPRHQAGRRRPLRSPARQDRWPTSPTASARPSSDRGAGRPVRPPARASSSTKAATSSPTTT